ncbi:nuclease-related domain-containing protein [Bacillus sp. MRMR6]|uniref:nuclease-related domain-containing protein n=1 Tax=Bacillus sp. MRMR6 TaxID=1928617 RepID=UPI001115281F|nr:nuclease-related domain-containing protein [Bacillus sp. MRMR6]
MIAKPYKMLRSIEMYQALIRRVSDSNISKFGLVNDYNNRLTGCLGEESVMNFHLDPLANSDFRIYHNLRLLYGNYYFQMDILIINTYFALVLEVKNRARDWHFDKVMNQTSFDNEGKKERANNPILQAKLQAYKLKGWLRAHGFQGLPILYLFVNANEKASIFITEDNKERWNACNSEFLLERIEQLAHFYKNETLDEKDLNRINKLLLTKNTPDEPNLFSKYNLTSKDIRPGVHCPECNALPMSYHAGKWRCKKCRLESKTAFEDSIHDYFLLINPTITNAAARKFLQIDSPKIMHHLLNSMNLTATGKYKHTIYQQTQ